MALPKALNEAWLIFQVLMVRIHFPPALSLRTISVCRGRRPLGWFRRADCRSAPTRPKPRNRCLSGAELKFRIHSPPAQSRAKWVCKPGRMLIDLLLDRRINGGRSLPSPTDMRPYGPLRIAPLRPLSSGVIWPGLAGGEAASVTEATPEAADVLMFRASVRGTSTRTTPSFPTCRGQPRRRAKRSADGYDVPRTAASSA